MKRLTLITSLAICFFLTFILTSNVIEKSTGNKDKIIKSTKVIKNKDNADINTVKQIKQLNIDRNRTLLLAGEVGPNAIDIALTITELNSISNDPIYLIIDSPGGNVLDGAMLISAIQSSEAPVYTICHRFCASMGAMILEYGKERYAIDRSIIMFHEAAGMFQGTFDKVSSRFVAINRYVNKLEKEVSERIGMSFDEYKSRTTSEIWIDSEDAVSENIIDSIVYISFKE